MTIGPEINASEKPRTTIMKEIMESAEPETQLPRLLDALDKYPSIIASLDGYNYPLATSRIALALSNGDITQADYDLCLSKFP